MKTLFLSRHAKSSWGQSGTPDHERPLNERGCRDAPAMARRLQKRGVRLDRLISSSAQRAQETASFFVEELEVPPEAFFLETALYGATAVDWLRLIQGLDESLDSVMMIGHNPTLTELANGLGRIDITNVPTCGILECRFSGDYWANFGDQLGELEIEFDFPKNAEL
ncbi:histidine phosphatase family protein [Verrucomicrobia bacterium]|nr:histidine phosphatase family protein [Verrucomicrobiota bacterium]MDB4797964.1 histidine phosphatase family protein [Verrucomicrobiota bacterium]